MKNLFLRNQSKFMAVASIGLVVFFLAMPAYGQVEIPNTVDAPRDVDAVFELLQTVFNILFVFLLVFAGIYIILAAFAYLTAGGDPEKVKTANHRVAYAAVAVAVGIFAKVIPNIVADFLRGVRP